MYKLFETGIINKDEMENWGYGIWIWCGFIEDFWWSSNVLNKEERDKRNSERWKRFRIELTFIKWTFEINIPIRKVGRVLYGRKIK